MIRIDKIPLQEFLDCVERTNPQNWEFLDKSVKTNTRKFILEKEQGNQCAYTELPLYYEKFDSHIDHLKRKDAAFFPKLTFDWTNLFVSCNFSDFGAKYKDQNYLKGTEAKEKNDLIINPHFENPADFFELTNWGELQVKTGLEEPKKIRANTTIEAFNLNHKSLKKRRMEIIQTIREYKNGGLDSEKIIACLAGSGFKSVIDFELVN